MEINNEQKIKWLTEVLLNTHRENPNGLEMKDLAKILVNKGLVSKIPLIGEQICSAFKNCQCCPLKALDSCMCESIEEETLFEIVEAHKDFLGYLYQPIMDYLNKPLID